MWTPDTRSEHVLNDRRYPCDLSDAEWATLESLFPSRAKTAHERGWPMREVINAIVFLLRGDCPWSMLPKHISSHQTTHAWLARFRDDDTWQTVNYHLVILDRERAGREVIPSAAVMDGESVKTTESGGSRGYNTAKKLKGRKRHALVDTDSRALLLQVRSADLQDRDGVVALLRTSSGRFPFIERVFADTANAGGRVDNATRIVVEIVRRLPDQVGFAVLPRRWVVERFFAGLNRNRNRHLAKDFEGTAALTTAFLYDTFATLLARRLARFG